MRLDLQTLRHANRLRLPEFKNNLGGAAHSQADGSDWAPEMWLCAVMGELGELANLYKKFVRGDVTELEYRREATKEFADILTYLDIAAMRAFDRPGYPHEDGINLSRATVDKFNEVSRRVSSSVRLMAPMDDNPRSFASVMILETK
jgi:hypothetical protein